MTYHFAAYQTHASCTWGQYLECLVFLQLWKMQWHWSTVYTVDFRSEFHDDALYSHFAWHVSQHANLSYFNSASYPERAQPAGAKSIHERGLILRNKQKTIIITAWWLPKGCLTTYVCFIKIRSKHSNNTLLSAGLSQAGGLGGL